MIPPHTPLTLGKGPGSRGDIQVKIYLPTQATIYTVADGPCTAVT